MFFKITSNNTYRDLVRNVRKILTSKISATEKLAAATDLHKLLATRLYENEKLLNSQPSFAKRCNHWNIIDSQYNRRVTNPRNPWLVFKQEFEEALKLPESEAIKKLEVSYSWFNRIEHKDDWIV